MKAAEALRNMPATEVRMEQVRRLGFGSSDLALTSLVLVHLAALAAQQGEREGAEILNDAYSIVFQIAADGGLGSR